MDYDLVHSVTVVLGFIAGALYIASHYMKTMVPLRICEIASNALFVIYGAMYPSWPTLALYGILVPLNSLRLYEMLHLIKKVRSASQGDLSMDWLKPFMMRQRFHKGEVLFRRGDEADGMFYTVSGTFRLTETGTDVANGEIIGELGLLAPDKRRTRTLECAEDGEVLTISYRAVEQLYFQNPRFGFYFLRLTTERLFRDIARLEDEVARLRDGQP